ncbi:MAG: hypothetical protein ACJ79K_11625 [Gemmatimonadaceae bacterium]
MIKPTLGLAALLLVGGCAMHPTRQANLQGTGCATPSRNSLGAVEDLKGTLSSSNEVVVEYLNGLGFAGVDSNSVRPVTDAKTCGRVSSAVSAYLRRGSPMNDLYVVRVGARYVALDQGATHAPQYVLTRKFEVTDYLVPPTPVDPRVAARDQR